MLDPAPRVVLDPRFGLASFGRTAKDARIVEEIYEHTIDVILRAEALGATRPCPRRTSSTSSTGTWSRPSSRRAARRRPSPARSPW